jgi:hypothetical protein
MAFDELAPRAAARAASGGDVARERFGFLNVRIRIQRHR